MGRPTPKTVTAAPRKQAKIQVTVLSKATGKPLRGVAGLLVGNDGSKLFTRSLGVTDAFGRLRFTESVGGLEIQVRHPNHAGEGLATVPGLVDTTVVFSGVLEEGSFEFTVKMVQVRAQVTLIVTEDPGGSPLGGVKVQQGLEAGLSDQQGRYVTKALATGVKHELVLSRNGHGPASGSAAGVVKQVVDLTGLTEVSDQTLRLQMKNFWGKVRSSDIKIDDEPFAEWFPKFASKYPAEHPTLMYHGKKAPTFPFASVLRRSGASFTKLFDDLPRWSSDALSIEEFVAVFMIVSNETGGSYKPISEKGTLAYMFYLNKGPNRLAGDQLAELGKLEDKARIVAWNAKGAEHFPGVGTDGITEEDLKECDFWKYRGRGFVQTTLRPLYIDRVDPVLEAAGLKATEDMTADELDDAVVNNDKVYYPLLAKEIASRRAFLVRANAEEWKPFGYAVAGQNNHAYAALYEWRCQELYGELRKAAEEGRLALA